MTKPFVEHILTHMEERDIKQNSMIFSEGDTDTNFYLITRGEVEITKKTPEGQNKVIAHIGMGEILGEGVLSGVYIKPASARAITEVRLFVLPKENFEKLLKEHAASGVQFLLSIIEAINRRLSQSNVHLLTLHEINRMIGQFGDDLNHFAEMITLELVHATKSREGALYLHNPYTKTWRTLHSSSKHLSDPMQVDKIKSNGQILRVMVKDNACLILTRDKDDSQYEDSQRHLLELVAEQVGNAIELAERKASDKARTLLQQKKITFG